MIRVLGSISEAEINLMHDTRSDKFQNFPQMPQRRRMPWAHVLTREGANGKITSTSFGGSFECLLDGLLRWSPADRYTSQEILTHTYFKEIKMPGHRCKELGLFDLTNEELAVLGDAGVLTSSMALKQPTDGDLSAANTPICAGTNMLVSRSAALTPAVLLMSHDVHVSLDDLDNCLDERVGCHQHRLTKLMRRAT